MWERFASPPIRNAGTMGGNVANGSPIGDSMPGLIALGASVILRNRERSRTLPMEDLYVGYMKKAMAADEILEAIEVPLPGARAAVPHVQAVEALRLRHLRRLCRVCHRARRRPDRAAAGSLIGGVAATPKRAQRDGARADRSRRGPRRRRGPRWRALVSDYTPLTDMRASADYRRQTAQNLLYRFYLETRPDRPLPAAEVSVFAVA